jgi:hypothetical protein
MVSSYLNRLKKADGAWLFCSVNQDRYVFFKSEIPSPKDSK